MSPARAACFETVKAKIGLPVELVTDETLATYVKPGKPLPPGYEFLSPTFKADVVRAYLMHHYGGGYTDIKETAVNWAGVFDTMNANPSIWVTGYPEIGPDGVAFVERDPSITEFLKTKWQDLIGNGAYICRAGTPFTRDWLKGVNTVMKGYLPELRKHPAQSARDAKGHIVNGQPSKFPVPWGGVHGAVFHPLTYKYRRHIVKTLPMPKLTGYL